MSTQRAHPSLRHEWLLLVVGGAAGALARYGVETLLPAPTPPGIPLGTLTVNLVGALVLGVVIRAAERAGDRLTWMRELLGVGFCGAFSTFSALSLEYVHFALKEERLAGVLYVVGSLVVGGLLAWIGARLVDLARPGAGSKGAPS